MHSDDAVVASSDIESHLETLDRLLTRLNEYELRVNLTKSKWLKETVDFLEFEISSDGIQPLASKVESSIRLEEPKNCKELRRIMVTFYRKHIPQYAQIIEPLQHLLNSSQPTHKRRNKANLFLNTMETTYRLPQHSESFSALKERSSTKLYILTIYHQILSCHQQLMLQKQLLVKLSMRHRVRTKNDHYRFSLDA